jgi:hypothetical protein
MSLAYCRPRLTLQGGESQRPPLTLVTQHELHALRAESARPVIEQ